MPNIRAKAMKADDLLKHWYRNYTQNGVARPVPSMWTRGTGRAFRSLATCQKRGWIKSQPDDRLNRGGWRHDITPAGRGRIKKQER